MAAKLSVCTQWMATEQFVAEIHSDSGCTPCPQPAVDFFTRSNSSSIAFGFSGTDRWSYSLRLHFKTGVDYPRQHATAPSYALPLGITILPHSSVDELASNRLVIRNVSITDRSFLSSLLPKVYGQKLPQPTRLHIRSWTLLVIPGAAADLDCAQLRKVCKEVAALNKTSFVTRQVSHAHQHTQFSSPADDHPPQAPVSEIVRLCKDDIRTDIAAAQYSLHP
jgi:hypothetical protein